MLHILMHQSEIRDYGVHGFVGILTAQLQGLGFSFIEENSHIARLPFRGVMTGSDRGQERATTIQFESQGEVLEMLAN
jgi:hypothetical protein